MKNTPAYEEFLKENPVDQPNMAYDPAPPYVAATPETEGFANVEAINYDMVGIPYLGDYAATAAGELREMLDDPGGREIRYLPKDKLKADPKNCFCIPVCGTSMTEAGVADGDEVVLGLAEEPENGAIMLVGYEGQSTLKRIAIRKGKVFLQWEDGSGREDEINEDGYQVLGKLLLILKS
jgi:SOS-response transcriptional repressor LexA